MDRGTAPQGRYVSPTRPPLLFYYTVTCFDADFPSFYFWLTPPVQRSHGEMSSGGSSTRATRDSSSPPPNPTSTNHRIRHTIESSSRRHSSSTNRLLPSLSEALAPTDIAYTPARNQVDLRRPAMSSATVIDLTSDDDNFSDPPPRRRGPVRLQPRTSRLPSPEPLEPVRARVRGDRHSRTINIDMGGLEPLRRRSSPDIEFVSERTVPRSERPTAVAQDDGGQQARRGAGVGRLGNLWNFLRRNPDPEAMETYTRERQAQNQRVDHDRRDRITAVIRNAAAHHQIRLPNEVTEGIGAMMDGFELIDDIPMPVLMDYAATGFAMGPGGRPPSPPYIEPSPAPEGFIKSTEEDDIVICPNCNDELGVGKDELKRQVWIAKACGHVRIPTHVYLPEVCSPVTNMNLGLLRRVRQESCSEAWA
jgi:hypothetical protein